MSHSPLVQTLAQASLLASLPEEHLARLAVMARRRVYRRGEVIFHQGDVGNGLHVLVSGVVKVVNDAESGEEAVLSILVPGDCFGELSLLDGEPRSARVEAMEAVETVMLDRSVFLQYFAEHPEMLMPVMIALCGVIRRLTEMVGDLTALDLEGRLAKKLLQLAERHGTMADGATVIQLPLTQEELAGMIGVTRASVNKLLGWFEKRGAIERRGRELVILDPERLRQRVV